MNETEKNHIIGEMRDLIARINEADVAYYQQDTEIMSNKQYDELCATLAGYEKSTGIVLSGSPSTRVSGEASSSLEKVRHETPMLSLDKTKDRELLKKWLGDNVGALSWKMDGLTIVLTYEGGVLSRAVTRGTNGEVGELVTENARNFKDVPVSIPYKDKITVRGEAVISYADFDRINKSIPDTDAKYRNPRNLASGSVRQRDAHITAQRSVHFIAFKLISKGVTEPMYDRQMEFLRGLGFNTVMPVLVTKDDLLDVMAMFEKLVPDNPFPSDGLVLALNDTVYADSLGATSKHPLGSMAFKWQDETAETTLRNIEWSASRTGLINPVAVFDPIELEDTIMERASVHNISIIEDLQLGRNDDILVYKANKIIPQIAENLTKSNDWAQFFLPATCPVCGRTTHVHISEENGRRVKTLHCENPDCPAKHIKRFDHMAGKTALDIKGMSEAIIERLMNAGLIHELPDLFNLRDRADVIASLDKMGETSTKNLLDAIDAARNNTFQHMLCGAGIRLIGNSQSKELAKHYGTIQELAAATFTELAAIPGIGDARARFIVRELGDEKRLDELVRLQDCLVFHRENAAGEDSKLNGRTVVITGSLAHYQNRDELAAVIEGLGGKVAGSVSRNTTVLVNNDIASESSKNRKAKELGIPIMTEEQFMSEWLP